MEERIAKVVKAILVTRFNIETDHFDWHTPLQDLNEDFKVLGYLHYLEQLLSQHFDKKIPLIENISADFHTPHDIRILIMKEL